MRGVKLEFEGEVLRVELTPAAFNRFLKELAPKGIVITYIGLGPIHLETRSDADGQK